MDAFAIYNEDKKRYLTGGTWHDVAYGTGTDNPLHAHLYTAEPTAERQAKNILTQYTKYQNDRPIPANPSLVVHKLSNPTVVVMTTTVTPTKPTTGYTIEFYIKPKGKDAGYQRKPYTDYIRNVYGMVNKVCDPNAYYYGALNRVLARGAKPTIWKTKKHAESVLTKLHPVMVDDAATDYWTYKAKVVEITG